MNKIEKLIQQLCPEGVEWRMLEQVCFSISAGGDLPENYIKGQAYPTKEFPYPIYSNGVGNNALYGYTDSFRIDNNAVTISARGTIGYHTVRKAKFTPIVRLVVLIPNEAIITIGFLNYVLDITLISSSGGSIPQLTVPTVNKISIPIPPLPIQQEIVSILDKFTTLEAELEAELEARTRQYEYYRNQLLSFSDEVPRMSLGKISLSTSTGVTPLASNPDFYGGNIPWLRTQEVRFVDIWDTEMRVTEKAFNETSLKWVPADCVIVAISGATAGRIGINKIPLTTNQHCCCFEINKEKALYRYVFHCLASFNNDLLSLKQGARGDLNAGLIKRFAIPVPSISEQERIVSILDKFDALVNDISVGLPAEIAARRKQYEYYRGKLLNFKNVNHE